MATQSTTEAAKKDDKKVSFKAQLGFYRFGNSKPFFTQKTNTVLLEKDYKWLKKMKEGVSNFMGIAGLAEEHHIATYKIQLARLCHERGENHPPTAYAINTQNQWDVEKDAISTPHPSGQISTLRVSVHEGECLWAKKGTVWVTTKGASKSSDTANEVNDEEDTEPAAKKLKLKRQSSTEKSEQRELEARVAARLPVVRTENQEKELSLLQAVFLASGKGSATDELHIKCAMCGVERNVVGGRGHQAKLNYFVEKHYDACSERSAAASARATSNQNQGTMKDFFKKK